MGRVSQRVFPKRIVRTRVGVCGRIEKLIKKNLLKFGSIRTIARIGRFINQCSSLQISSPTQYFWYRTTLMISEDINSPEIFNWKIALALVIAWILVYMCMIKGIASSGKVFPSKCSTPEPEHSELRIERYESFTTSL